MWLQFGNSMDSIAIQSDPWYYNKPKPIFTDTREYKIKAGPVKYLPLTSRHVYSIYNRPSDNDMFWHKDESLAYENEWRMIITIDDNEFATLSSGDKYGLAIQVTLKTLIEKVYFSPRMSRHMQVLWKDTLKDYGLECETRESRFVNV
jgi:hypothetical protein